MLHVSLLGEQAITDSGTGAVRPWSPRMAALVTFLVTHAGLPQGRQRIAELFWPDSPPHQALTNLRRELHHLRNALGEEPALVVTAKDLCWRDGGTSRVDVRVFDIEHAAALASASAGDRGALIAHATAAIAEYRGDLLPGVYDDWLTEARADLERRCVDLCDLICQAHRENHRRNHGENHGRNHRGNTGNDDLQDAMEAARRRIRLRPLEEVGYRALMALQAEQGDGAGAVSTYHHCASIVERELGIVPDQATRDALQSVLSRMRPGDAPATEKPERAAGRSGFAVAELVGRSRELRLLDELWATAAGGRPSVVLVRGSPGVGKSLLLAETAQRARRQGAVVAGSRCFGTPGRLALAPVADWLRTPATQSAVAVLDPVWRAEVGRLVPPDDGAREIRPGLRTLADGWQRHRFFEGLARALLGTGRPLLLLLDDMQWCDQETLAFLTFCLGFLPEAPLLVAGAVREENLGERPALLDWSARMRTAGVCTELCLNPLEAGDTARLAEAITGRHLSAEDRTLLYATTGGYPLYVVEAMRTHADSGGAPLPAGDLTAVLRGRLEQVSADAREVAGLASAVGQNFTLDLLAGASDLDAGTVVRAVDELWQRRIIHELPDGYDFSHDLLRETAYAQVSPPRRWLMHRRLAEGLERAHAGDTDRVSARLAEQYARGGRPDLAVTYYRRAAGIASSRFAHDEAIRLHDEALSIVRARAEDGQELEILEAQAAPLNAGRGFSSPELQQVLQRSVDLAERLHRTESLLTALVGLWATRFVQGNSADAYEVASRALALAKEGSELSASAHFAFAGSALSLGRQAEALRHFALAVTPVGQAHSLTIGTRPDVHGTAWAAHAHWLTGQEEEARANCRHAVELARSMGHPYNLALALGYAGITHHMSQDFPAMTEAVSELRALCERYGFAYYREWGLILDGWCRGGEHGIELVRRGIDNLKADGAFARMPYWLSLLADLEARNERPHAARATLDAALAAARARDDLWWLPEVMRLRAAYDEPEEATGRLRAAARLAGVHGSVALLRRCERDLGRLRA
jgi:DNA-binding SARP family transcriptional activator/tetratricopeptide (TPR) repeat protein